MSKFLYELKFIFGFILIAATIFASGLALAESSGKVEFASAGVMITSSDGASKVATKGLELNSGDSIVTNTGRVQMRMVDGAFFSLQPNTQFRLDEYALNKTDTSKERSFVSLIKGGLRSVTGLIGKNNRKNFKLNTPTATIGIRGTEFSALSSDKGDTFSVFSGGISVCNAGGCQNVSVGETAFSQNQNTKPALTVVNPNADKLNEPLNQTDLGANRVISTDVISAPPAVVTPEQPPLQQPTPLPVLPPVNVPSPTNIPSTAPQTYSPNGAPNNTL